MAVKLTTGNGKVWIDFMHQGRIFAELDGELLHKFDTKLAENPSPTEFNNLGGNSLWPGPEGGAFAYNYLKDEWLVQPGINTACPHEEKTADGDSLSIKRVTLGNHKGNQMEMDFTRSLKTVDVDALLKKYNVRGLAYQEDDEVNFVKPVDPDEAVIAAWSLEQFSGSDGITAFGLSSEDNAKDMINADFYGDPWPRLKFTGKQFAFKLGGENRLQIGISSRNRPVLIGVWVPSRNLVIIRTTPYVSEGTYINIADNDQPKGVYSAADQYSIFNGATLNFFELETIAPYQMRNGKITGSHLTAKTYFFKGNRQELSALLKQEFNISMEDL